MALPVLLSAGCAGHADWLEARAWPVRVNAPPKAFRAGAARVDMTPPVGYPTGGHGPAGSVSRGYWGRLYARAFYFEDTMGRKLVLVSCETFAIPRALHFEVARRVADLGLYREQIVLAATHTHQGPGNYMSVAAYNQFGSNKPGFDVALFNFLAVRISEAIRLARLNAEADRKIELVVHTGTVGDLLRNRAPLPFLLNPNREEIMKDLDQGTVSPCLRECGRRCPDSDGFDCEPPDGWDCQQGCPRLRALDRTITLLEVRQKGQSPWIGLLVFLAVHPTVLHHEAPFFSSDFTGVTVRSLERTLGGDKSLPVVAFFNGADGDVSARRRQRDLRDVLALARLFEADIRRVLKESQRLLAPPLGVDVRYVEADTSFERECDSASWPAVAIGRRPLFGASGFGGGEGDRTAVYDLGWKEGARTEPRSGQGPKLGAFDSRLLPDIKLTGLLAPRESFPRELPITWATIGSFAVATFPVEMTTAMAAEIRKKLGLKHGEAEIVGLANEYASYVTTPSEYAAQNYEGGSTIWGPQEGPYLGCVLEKLIHAEQGPPSRPPASDAWFDPGPLPSEPFGPEFCGDRRTAPDEELDHVLLDNLKRPHRKLPWFQWEEALEMRCHDFVTTNPVASTNDVHCTKAGSERDLPKVEILVEDGPHWNPFSTPAGAENDMGFGILTMLVDAADESGKVITCGGAAKGFVCDAVTSFVSGSQPYRRRWASFWITPMLEDRSGKRFRFEISTRFNGQRCSEPFTVDPDGVSEGRVPEFLPGASATSCPR